MTIPMTHMDTGKTADVHPNEVAHMKQHGWREAVPVAVVPPPPPPPAPPVPPSKRETLTIPRKGV